MQFRDNTIFIFGGSLGTGRGLAEAFHNKMGNRVSISGRWEERLKEI